MTHDLILRGGTLVLGDGQTAPFVGDVAFKDGRLSAVGSPAAPRVEGNAAEERDVSGAHLAPGWVDIHSHYDGQVSWDADLAPSVFHGVTTTVFGNCGVGFAPVRERDRQRLVDLMEGVEDIPGSALSEGIRWGWERFPAYLDAIDSFAHTIDFAVHVPHDALRVFAMGERAVAEQAATEDDIRLMQTLLREGLDAGAVGLSVGRTDNHRNNDGAPTPTSEADARELTALASVLRGRTRGVLQAVSDFDLTLGEQNFAYEWSLLEQMAEASGGRPMSVSLMERDQLAEQWRWILQRAEAANTRGLDMKVQVASRPIGVLLGFEATFHPFMGYPSYKAIAHLPHDEKLATLRDPAFKARLLSEKTDKVTGDGSPLPPMADFFLENFGLVTQRLYRLGERPDYLPEPESCIAAEAARAGRHAMDVVYDALLEQDGRALLYFPLYNFHTVSDAHLAEMLRHPLAMHGLGDGGAHVGTICDASMPTTILAYWGRDRSAERGGTMPLEHLIGLQTGKVAAHLGLTDRGLLQPGLRADVNVFELDKLGVGAPRLHPDLPAGGQRLLQPARGYVTSYVAGAAVTEDGALTGARPGRLVRAR